MLGFGVKGSGYIAFHLRLFLSPSRLWGKAGMGAALLCGLVRRVFGDHFDHADYAHQSSADTPSATKNRATML